MTVCLAHDVMDYEVGADKEREQTAIGARDDRCACIIARTGKLAFMFERLLRGHGPFAPLERSQQSLNVGTATGIFADSASQMRNGIRGLSALEHPHCFVR